MANKDFRLTAIMAVRDTMSPVLKTVTEKWDGFKQTVASTEFKDLNRQLKLAQRSFKDFAGQAQEVASAIGAPFTAIAGAVGFSVKSAVTGFAQVGDGLDKMSARVGVNAETLQEWTFAATHAGASQQILEDSLKDLSKNLAETAAGGTGPASQLFAALGISAKDAAGKLRPVEEVFAEVADAIKRNEDPSLRAKMAMTLMGESGRKLVPMLSAGAEGLAEAGKQAREFGLVMSNDAVAAAATMTDHTDDMKASIAAIGHEIGYRLSPIVIKMADRFRDLAAANKGALGEKFERVARSFADALGKIDFEGIASAILTIADYGVRAFNALGGFNTVLYGMGALIAGKSLMAVVSLGSSLFGLVQSFGAVATAAKAFGAVATASMGPIGWALGALALAAGVVVANWDRIGPTVIESLESVVDFAAGAFEVCKEKFGAVAGAILTTATGLFRGDFKTLFSGLDDLALASFNLLPDAWSKAAVSWYESVKQTVRGIGSFISDFFAKFDFSSFIPDWALKMFGGSSATQSDKTQGAERPVDLAPVTIEPESRTRMSGEMLVRVAASPGTTAQLACMSADGMKLVGNVGYSDRFAEDY